MDPEDVSPNDPKEIKSWRSNFTFKLPFSLVLVSLLLSSIVIAVAVAITLTVIANNDLMRDQAQQERERVADELASVIHERLGSAENIAWDFSTKISMGAITLPTGISTDVDRNFALTLSATLSANSQRIGGSFFKAPNNFIYGIFESNTVPGGYDFMYNYANNTMVGWNWSLPLVQIIGRNEGPYVNFTTTYPTWFYSPVNRSIPDHTVWSESYNSWETFGISTWTYPAIANGPRKLIGTVAVQIHIPTVGAILRDTPLSGVSFLIDQNIVKFIGCSDKSVDRINTYITGPVNVTANATFNQSMVMLAINEVLGRFGSFGADIPRESFWVNDYVISLSPLTKPGLRWLMVVIDKPVVGSVEKETLLASAGTTLFFMLLTVVFGFVVTRPLKLLSADMKAVSRLKFDSVSTKSNMSFLKEVRDMQEAFLLLKQGAEALTKIVPPEAAKLLMSGSAVLAAEGEETITSQDSTGDTGTKLATGTGGTPGGSGGPMGITDSLDNISSVDMSGIAGGPGNYSGYSVPMEMATLSMASAVHPLAGLAATASPNSASSGGSGSGQQYNLWATTMK